MLVTAMLGALFWIAERVVSAFPTADLAWVPGVQSSIANVVGFMSGLNAYLPIAEVMTAIGIFAAVWTVITVVVFVRKVWSSVSGGGGI